MAKVQLEWQQESTLGTSIFILKAWPWVLWHVYLIPALWSQRQADLREF